MSPWIPVLVSIFVFVFGLAVQGVGAAYFLGRMKEGQNNTTKLVDALLSRMASFDSLMLAEAQSRGDVSARLIALERNTAGMAVMRDEVIKLGAEFAAHAKVTQDAGERVRGDISNVTRQLAAIMNGSAGSVIEIHRPRRRRGVTEVEATAK